MSLDEPPFLLTPGMYISLAAALASLQQAVASACSVLDEVVAEDPDLGARIGPAILKLKVAHQVSVSRTPAVPATRPLIARRLGPVANDSSKP